MNENTVVYIEGEHHDTLQIGDVNHGRIDNHSLTDLLSLLAREGLIKLEIVTT